MDGFVDQATNAQRGCSDPTNPACAATDTPDVMGYHTRGDIPNYWSYADNFVLQDHMFEPNASWSLPEHLFQVSEWSAQLHAARQPVELHERAAGARPPARLRRTPRKRAAAAGSDLRVDRHDVPPPPEPGLVGLLRRVTAASPTARTTPRCRARRCAQNAIDARHLEPAAVLRHRPRRRRARQHPVGRQLLQRGQGGEPAGGVVGRAVGRGERAPARRRSASASRT